MGAPVLIPVFVLVFAAIAAAIVKARLNPALALLLGTIVLGVASGVPLADLAASLDEGFGSLMAEVGLLISLGVIMGFVMSAYGAVQRIVQAVVGIFGRRGSPFAFALVLTGVTPAIYFDVLLVLVAPIAQRVAHRSGRPVAALAGPVALGLAAGNALVVPGAALLAYVGAVGLSPSEVLLPGLAVALPAAAVSTLLYLLVIERLRWWDPALDEEAEPGPDPADTDTYTDREPVGDRRTPPSLAAALAPVATVLVLILGGILAPLAGVRSAVVDLLGGPVIALLSGVLVALGILVARQGLRAQEGAVDRALSTVGSILVVTAVAGSLGVVIAASGVQTVLQGLFEAHAALPLLLVWVVAALLRTAIGGQTVAGLTAIGIIAPLVAPLGLSPVLVVLAAGAGGCFGGQFSDNAFWMLRSLFGLSTRGALKTYTLAQSMLSVVVLAIVLVVDLVS
jgi:GntP family gluconate:H+ symporter